MEDKRERCPHCDGAMQWDHEHDDWVCPDCGYVGVIPEHPLSYVTPTKPHMTPVVG